MVGLKPSYASVPFTAAVHESHAVKLYQLVIDSFALKPAVLRPAEYWIDCLFLQL